MSLVWLQDAAVMTYRVFGVVVGGYALWSGLVPLCGMGLASLGLAIGEAMLISAMLGVLAYVGILIWGFGAPASHRPATLILLLASITILASMQLAPSEIAV